MAKEADLSGHIRGLGVLSEWEATGVALKWTTFLVKLS